MLTSFGNLVRNFHNDLGSRQGPKHAAPDLSHDIDDHETTKPPRDYRVYYEIEPGCVIESDESSVPNIVSAGFSTLLTALREYNDGFRKL